MRTKLPLEGDGPIVVSGPLQTLNSLLDAAKWFVETDIDKRKE